MILKKSKGQEGKKATKTYLIVGSHRNKGVLLKYIVHKESRADAQFFTVEKKKDIHQP